MLRAPPGEGRGRAEGAAGFTLVEFLVATVLAAIVGGAVVSLIIQQNRFYAQHGEYVYAEQTMRAAGEVVAAELRMLAPADLRHATADSVAVRYDTYQAVVCESTPALDEATLFVYDSATNANLAGGTLGYAVSPSYDSAHTYDDGWTPSDLTIGSVARTTCTDNGAPDLPEAWRYRTLVGWSASSLGGVPARGSYVRKYGELSYHFDPSSFSSGTALWRNGQELVAPFDSGAAFSYLMASGDTLSAPGTLADVRGIRITATAVGEDDPRVEASRDLDFTIWLRNER